MSGARYATASSRIGFRESKGSKTSDILCMIRTQEPVVRGSRFQCRPSWPETVRSAVIGWFAKLAVVPLH
jgi:hypothetical protein